MDQTQPTRNPIRPPESVFYIILHLGTKREYPHSRDSNAEKVGIIILIISIIYFYINFIHYPNNLRIAPHSPRNSRFKLINIEMFAKLFKKACSIILLPAIILSSTHNVAMADPTEDRLPGCMREQMKYDNVVQQVVTTRVPVGTMIVSSAEMNDPRYPGSQGWRKFSVIEYQRDWSRANPNIETHFKFELHYLHNIHSGSIAQVKLKNSFQEGCTGKVVQKSYSGAGGINEQWGPSCGPTSATVSENWYVWRACSAGECTTGAFFVGYDVESIETDCL